MESHIRELQKDYFANDAEAVAVDLLGRLLVCDVDGQALSGVITETEAYGGAQDKASHSYKGITKRNFPMFGPCGVLYVYQIYGMYYCLNIVTGGEGDPQAVLIRAVEPVSGIDIMAKNRNITTYDPNDLSPQTKQQLLYNISCGPGKLCRAYSIDKRHNNLPMQKPGIYVSAERYYTGFSVATSPRINVDYAEEWAMLPLRFFIKDSPYISKHKFNKTAKNYPSD